jgi:hypothetical protein
MKRSQVQLDPRTKPDCPAEIQLQLATKLAGNRTLSEAARYRHFDRSFAALNSAKPACPPGEPSIAFTAARSKECSPFFL